MRTGPLCASLTCSSMTNGNDVSAYSNENQHSKKAFDFVSRCYYNSDAMNENSHHQHASVNNNNNTNNSKQRALLRSLYRECIALAKIIAATSKKRNKDSDNDDAVANMRQFARRLIDSASNQADTAIANNEADKEGAESSGAHVDDDMRYIHALDAMTKKACFMRTLVPLWRRPNRSRRISNNDCDNVEAMSSSYPTDDVMDDSSNNGIEKDSHLVTTYVVDRHTGQVVKQQHLAGDADPASIGSHDNDNNASDGNAVARDPWRVRVNSCKETQFRSMAEARQKHHQLLQRQFFGKHPGTSWKETF